LFSLKIALGYKLQSVDIEESPPSTTHRGAEHPIGLVNEPFCEEGRDD